MRRILEIRRHESGVSKDGTPYTRTYALVEGSDEVYGFGTDYAVGELVMVFFHDKYGAAKMRKPD